MEEFLVGFHSVDSLMFSKLELIKRSNSLGIFKSYKTQTGTITTVDCIEFLIGWMQIFVDGLAKIISLLQISLVKLLIQEFTNMCNKLNCLPIFLFCLDLPPLLQILVKLGRHRLFR